MTDDRMGGIALIAGTAGSIATMILHPSGHNLFAPGQLEPMVRLGVIAHTLGIASMPISTSSARSRFRGGWHRPTGSRLPRW